jgi:2-aminobenzoylacetyl-CoA thioesterase
MSETRPKMKESEGVRPGGDRRESPACRPGDPSRFDARRAMDAAPVRLAEGLWLLGHYHYNLYLVRGRHGTALFEVGVSATADGVVRQLESLDARPDHLILSHPHADHLTGLGTLRDRYPEARLVVGEGAAEFTAHPKAVEALVAEDRHIAGVLEAAGRRRDRAPLESAPTLEGSLVAREGDAIDLGGVTIEFLEARGHSPGHLAVHVPQSAAVLLSDALGFHLPGRGFWPMPFTGVGEYLCTLDRLEALGGEVLGLGHQGPIQGESARLAFRQARKGLEDFAEIALEEGREPEALAAALFERLYREELVINSEANIRNCVRLLIRRFREAYTACEVGRGGARL